MTYSPVLVRFLQLVDAIRYAGLELDPAFALAVTLDEARSLYYGLLKGDISYLAMGEPGMFNVRTLQVPGSSLVPPPTPSKEHNVWGTICGITIVIKGVEDE